MELRMERDHVSLIKLQLIDSASWFFSLEHVLLTLLLLLSSPLSLKNKSFAISTISFINSFFSPPFCLYHIFINLTFITSYTWPIHSLMKQFHSAVTMVTFGQNLSATDELSGWKCSHVHPHINGYTEHTRSQIPLTARYMCLCTSTCTGGCVGAGMWGEKQATNFNQLSWNLKCHKKIHDVKQGVK